MTRLTLLLVLLPAVPAVPAGLAGQADSSYWKASGELSFTDVSGNRTLSLLTTGVRATLLGHHAFELATLASMRYGRSNGDLAVESYEGQGDLRFLPRQPVSPFLNLKATRDKVRNLNVRVAVAVGADLNLLVRTGQRLSVGVAVLQDYESRDLPPGTPDPSSVSLTRLNLRVFLASTVREGVTVESRSMIEPAAGDFGDYLFTSHTAFRVALSRRLGLQVSYTYNHDATPPPGVLFKDDRTLAAGILVELGRT